MLTKREAWRLLHFAGFPCLPGEVVITDKPKTFATMYANEIGSVEVAWRDEPRTLAYLADRDSLTIPREVIALAEDLDRRILYGYVPADLDLIEGGNPDPDTPTPQLELVKGPQ